MSGSSDIAKLFKSFGGDASNEYREIVETDRQVASRSRWPILEQIPLAVSPSPAVLEPVTPHDRSIPVFSASTLQVPKPQPTALQAPPLHAPAFHSLRVQSPTTARAGSQASIPEPEAMLPRQDSVTQTLGRRATVPSPTPMAGSLKDTFQRIARPTGAGEHAAGATGLFKKESKETPGMSSLFQRLRRP